MVTYGQIDALFPHLEEEDVTEVRLASEKDWPLGEGPGPGGVHVHCVSFSIIVKALESKAGTIFCLSQVGSP